MSRSSIARTTLRLAASVSLCVLAGCAGEKKTTQTRGLYVTDETIALLKASNSDQDWIFLLYGTPGKKKIDKATGNEVWSWDFYKATKKQEIERPTQVYERTMFIEFDNGTIVRAWATSTDETS